ncbi:MAG TPA: outer membrane protein [Pseudorhodoplanes sp.]|jgi:outer membrane immunogenic protein|nr:outer membrane protein [Pseudorhodoplanes sp.]
MRKTTLAFLATVALAALSHAASAADLGTRQQPVYKAPPLQVAEWTGFYFGIAGGWAWDRTSQTNTTTLASTGGFSGDGGLIGGTAGYNWQSGNVVFGLEGDMSWARIEASTTTNCPTGCSNRLDWLATARARAGLLVSPTTLAYVTGGGAFTGISSSTLGASGDDTKAGWTVGAGVEQKFAGPWSAKLEYLYTDFGQTDAYVTGGQPVVNDYARAHVLRAGINYQFGAPGAGWR